MKFFNTAGPVNCQDHYCLPPLGRFDLDGILSLIAQKKYFVLHAPRQTGKTSCLLSLMAHLNEIGEHRCLYINVEAAQGARENVKRGVRAILNEMALRARVHLTDQWLTENWAQALDASGEDNALNEILTRWAIQSPKPVILLIDEIDALVGDTLISVLRQIRSGYDRRSSEFPQSIVLCGVRDVRDYRIHSDRDESIITGGSAFNIKAKSLQLGNFNENEIHTLLHEHEKETGQAFRSDAKGLVWDYTRGQPWLVNALAYETCFEMSDGKNRLNPITVDMIVEAKENLVQRRETHLDQLADKLKEDRVRRVIGPVLEGTSLENIAHDDIQYLLDLGLISTSEMGLEIANAIYREIIPRELTTITQYNLEPLYRSSWYVMPDGKLDTMGLLSAFQEFFRENSEIWLERFDYKEAGPHLLLQAFLQRIVNSGGRIDREYGLGRKRTDLLVVWPHPTGVQKVVIELKILYKSLERTMAEGLEQTTGYMDRSGADEGHLVIFDRSSGRKWADKIFRKTMVSDEKTIVVWGM
jgi:hypothetical protein